MFRLTDLSIRSLLLLITFVVAVPAAGIILYFGIQFRHEMLDRARTETVKLADLVASEQQHLVTGAEQLMSVLAQLPEVKNSDAAKVEPILRELHRLNPMYSNIVIADRKGNVWASAVPVKPPFVVADRRYFRNALASGRVSSGEYVIGRATVKPVFNLAYPLKDLHGAVTGVINVGFELNQYRLILGRMRLPAATSFSLLDHKGVILFRVLDQDTWIGKPYPPEEFRKMKEGAEAGTDVRQGFVGDYRIISYRKMSLAGEATPYMYVTAGIPVQAALHNANKALMESMALWAFILVLACAGALLIGKWSILDRFKLLEEASRRLAAGDLQVRVSDLVVGGEPGSLARSFDSMARELSRREAEGLQAAEDRLGLQRQLLHAQKLESLGVLAGGIAHDFNNILTAIIGNADLALMRLGPQSPALENLKRIEQSASRAADLAQQMLAYSGKGKFVVETVDLNLLLSEMLHMLEISISKKAVLSLKLAPELPALEADATQIHQIVMNLVINASEAIGDRNGSITVTTGSGECDRDFFAGAWASEEPAAGRYVFLEVQDTGCGMDQETMAKIFDPFFTTKFTGRGLGMAAVLGIVRGHQGSIKVSSEPGKGSDFLVALPACGKPARLARHSGSQVQVVNGGGTVLLVDDEEAVRNIGKGMLEELGFSVITASDGREAVEVFKATRDIAFVILDLTMPVLDGEQCFRELRQLNAEVKVLMSSGYSEQDVIRRFWGMGLAGFLQKPYRFSALKQAVLRIVEA